MFRPPKKAFSTLTVSRSGINLGSDLLHKCSDSNGVGLTHFIPRVRVRTVSAKLLKSVHSGEVSERFKEHAWKACVGEILPWVRIPPSPPILQLLYLVNLIFLVSVVVAAI